MRELVVWSIVYKEAPRPALVPVTRPTRIGARLHNRTEVRCPGVIALENTAQTLRFRRCLRWPPPKQLKPRSGIDSQGPYFNPSDFWSPADPRTVQHHDSWPLRRFPPTASPSIRLA